MELLDRSKLPFYQDGNAFTRGLAGKNKNNNKIPKT